jgi:hypothetical protein
MGVQLELNLLLISWKIKHITNGYAGIGKAKVLQLCNKTTQGVSPMAELYSRDLRNSSPQSRRSPETSWRSTLAEMGGVSLGRTLDCVGEGAGIVRCTI